MTRDEMVQVFADAAADGPVCPNCNDAGCPFCEPVDFAVETDITVDHPF